MWFLRRRHQIREALGPIYFAIVGVVLGGLVLDVLFQWTFAVILFQEITPNLTFSKRMERYREDPKYKGTWKMRWADFICERILNPYDPTGKHC
jgi:hypothetical protein